MSKLKDFIRMIFCVVFFTVVPLGCVWATANGINYLKGLI